MKIKKELVNKILDSVVTTASCIFGYNLEKPIEYHHNEEYPQWRSFYPCGWNEDEEKYHLGCIDEIDIKNTWWNHSPNDKEHSAKLDKLKAETCLTVVLAHEVAHMFESKNKQCVWDMEKQAMKYGYDIALALDKNSKVIFENAPNLSVGKEPEKISYADIGKDKELCRNFQWQAYQAMIKASNC
ncbi:MAG: hypothetical protein P1P64_04440 [Treponemataceae bacterium]